jgi:hypothetical protein
LNNLLRNILYLIPVFFILVLVSCGNNSVVPIENTGTVIYDKVGLIDSAVVNGCYPNTRRFFSDTLDLSGYSKVKVEFDGHANSDGSYIKVFYNSYDSSNVEKYSAEDKVNINNHHEFEFSKPADRIWMEMRIYINPPVCGQGEFKFTSARDLRIYGIK